jgi:Cu(I)/Ag(I) efflux system membrane fusion protein
MKTAKTYIKVGGIAVAVVVVAFLLGRLTAGNKAQHDHGEHEAAATPAKAQVWTCSMHPQFKLPDPGKCPICFMDLIPLESEDEGGGMRELSVSDVSAELMEIETAAAERQFVKAEVRMVGKVDYDETRVSYITAWVPGRLDRLFVDYTGVPVRKGDHMVYLYSPELLSAQEELLQALQAAKELQGSEVSLVRETTEATITAVREKLRLWGVTEEQVAEIEKRGKASDHMTIYAPSGGIVIHKNAQEGMYVKTGTKIYTIADLSQVWVTLDAYESDLAWLKYGQRVEFTSESYPGETFVGAISFIHPVLNTATRTVKVRVNVPNEDGRLKPGMFVRAATEASVATGGRVMDAALAGKWISPMHPEVIKNEPGPCDVCGMPLVRAESLGYVGQVPSEDDKPLVIPATAPLLTGKRAIVYVQVEDQEKPTFEGREIVLGPRAGDYYVVKYGLAEGERVVTRGAFKLDAELQIQAKPSMMTPDGGGGGDEHAHHGMSGPGAETEESSPSVELPALVRSQIHDVLAAAHALSEVEQDTELREAFATLGTAVASVNTDTLSGDAANIWKEYAMLLGNDAVEGRAAPTAQKLAALARTTAQHAMGMQSKLGLSHDMRPTSRPERDPAFAKQLAAVVDGYLVLQTALAGDDAAKAKDGATTTLAALGKVQMALVTGDDHTVWMKQAAELKTVLEGFGSTADIEAARAQFALLSESVTALLAHFGVGEGRLYKAWCPMAFDNRGASWIQGSEEIANPYFGDMMLRCGEIKEVLK